MRLDSDDEGKERIALWSFFTLDEKQAGVSEVSYQVLTTSNFADAEEEDATVLSREPFPKHRQAVARYQELVKIRRELLQKVQQESPPAVAS